MNHLQGRNGDADVWNGLMDTVGKAENGMNGESSIDIYTYIQPCVKLIADDKLPYNSGNPVWCSVLT